MVVRSWDHAAKRAIEATAKPENLTSAIGVARDAVVGALSGGATPCREPPRRESGGGGRPRQEHREPGRQRLRRGRGRLRRATRPSVRAATVKIEGVGKRFSGTYTLTSTTHIFRAPAGYRTQLPISGESERSLVDLLTPAQAKRWGNSVVLGIVTQNEDPAGNGAGAGEVPGARRGRRGLLGPGRVAGGRQGQGPADDSAASATRWSCRSSTTTCGSPYVLGAVWNGEDTPGDLVQTDGSFALTSEKKMIVNVKEEITWKGEKELTFEVGSAKLTCKKDGTIQIEGQNVTIKGSGSVKIEASGNLRPESGRNGQGLREPDPTWLATSSDPGSRSPFASTPAAASRWSGTTRTSRRRSPSSSAPRPASARCGRSSAAASTTTSSRRSTPYVLGRLEHEIRQRPGPLGAAHRGPERRASTGPRSAPASS